MNKKTNDLVDEIEALANDGGESELEALRREKSIRDNVAREIEEFYILFPDTDVDDIPDEVWDACRDGSGICAQYALWQKREEMKKHTADAKNEENISSAIPDVEVVTEEVFFTPEAVSSMSKSEVEKNYQAIMESMKKWK